MQYSVSRHRLHVSPHLFLRLALLTLLSLAKSELGYIPSLQPVLQTAFASWFLEKAVCISYMAEPTLVFFFFFGRIRSSLLRAGFLYLQRVGATLHCSAWASHCGGFSCCSFSCYRSWALGAQASVAVAHGLSCFAACGIFLDKWLNQCPLRWQEDS